MTQAAHSVLGGSTCERWWNCPGSVNMTKKFPTVVNRDMAEGSVAHWVSEEIMKGRLIGMDRALYEPIVGMFKKQDGFNIEITNEMLNCSYTYADYLFDLIETNFVSTKSVNIEHKVVVDKDLGLFGTSDSDMRMAATLFVGDYKYGAGKMVKVPKNKQLRYYWLGSYFALKKDEQKKIHSGKYAIIQPRLGGIHDFEESVEDLMDFHKELLVRAKAALEPSPPVIAGDWCTETYCPARANCPAFQKYRKAETGMELEAMALMAVDSKFDVNARTPEMVAQAFSKLHLLDDLKKEITTAAFALANEGKLPGYKIVQSYGNRQWKPEVKEQLEKEYGGIVELTETKFKSPSQVEEALRTYNRGIAKKADKVRVKDIEENYTFKSESSLIIVPESDNRPDAKPNALEDFKGIEIDADLVIQ